MLIERNDLGNLNIENELIKEIFNMLIAFN